MNKRKMIQIVNYEIIIRINEILHTHKKKQKIRFMK